MDRSIHRRGVAEQRARSMQRLSLHIDRGRPGGIAVANLAPIQHANTRVLRRSRGGHPPRTPRRHWRNHLSMSAPRADIGRRKWSLTGGIDDRRLSRSAVYRTFMRASAQRLSNHRDLRRRGCSVCFLTRQRWQRESVQSHCYFLYISMTVETVWDAVGNYLWCYRGES